jgi:hypothetical protein
MTVLERLRRATDALADYDFDFVQDGCGEVTDVLEQYAKARGWRGVRRVLGKATRRGQTFAHAWLTVDGVRFDPVAHAVGWRASRYVARIAPSLIDIGVDDPEHYFAVIDEALGDE